MTPKIKIGDLVKLKLPRTSLMYKFNGVVGLVTDRNSAHTNNKLFKVLWCSSKLREYDVEPWWLLYDLEVVQRSRKSH